MNLRSLFWPLWFAGLALFGVMAGFATVASRFPGDLPVAEWVQGIDGLSAVADAVNAAGDFPLTLAVTLVSLAWLGLTRRFVEGAFIVLSFVPRALREAISALVARPRPDAELVEVRDEAAGFSFPSGHVVGAMVLYGLLFYLVQIAVPRRELRAPLQIVLAFVIFAAGPARVYVGVHWPSDVLGGHLYGALALALLILGYRHVRRRFQSGGFVRRKVHR
ncbi:MAG: phosphatase PAP2 family protein [Dehalococcoidia bacterium]|nr:phosphatase PAP2 family protein [Dehalococcoidia bacterium]